MRFKEEQKRAILFYILKKIEEKNDNICCFCEGKSGN